MGVSIHPIDLAVSDVERSLALWSKDIPAF
jgi:hypothetical protein